MRHLIAGRMQTTPAPMHDVAVSAGQGGEILSSHDILCVRVCHIGDAEDVSEKASQSPPGLQVGCWVVARLHSSHSVPEAALQAMQGCEGCMFQGSQAAGTW